MSEERLEKIFRENSSHVDERGIISNYLLSEPINWVGFITARRGDMRANHYHPVQEQKVLVTSGGYISVSKDFLGDPSFEKRIQVVRAGDLVVTPPNVAHTMIFYDDTTFLNLVNGDRSPEGFGVHTVKHELVKPEEVRGYLTRYTPKHG